MTWRGDDRHNFVDLEGLDDVVLLYIDRDNGFDWRKHLKGYWLMAPEEDHFGTRSMLLVKPL